MRHKIEGEKLLL